MKKFLIFILSFVMFFTVIPFCSVVEADSVATITVGNSIAAPGNTVGVDISIKNNPGIMAMAFCLEYDSDVFEYVDYTKGYLTNYTITNHSDKGMVSFVNVEERNENNDGVLLTFNFKINTTAPNGEYVFVIKNNNPDKYGTSLHNSFANSGEQYVTVNAISGKVMVNGEYVAKKGDINGDGKINNKDLAFLMQHLNGWSVEIIVDVADVNADNKINNKDYAMLMQYVNGWNIELK